MTYKPLKLTTHIVFWVSTCFVMLAFILLFKKVLLPFVLGMAVAYFLNPMVGKLVRLGFSRSVAALMILSGFMLLLICVIAMIAPLIIRELSDLIDNFPDYVRHAAQSLKPLFAKVRELAGISDDNSIDNIVDELLKNGGGSAVGAVNIILQNIIAGGQAFIDAVSLMVIMPIVAYFMMKDWERVTSWIHDLIPLHARGVVLDLLKQIDSKLSGFVRGQISVAVMLGCGYAVALTIAGLKYGFLIGLGAGVMSVIPMVGSAMGLIISVAVAWFQSYELVFVGLVAAIFLIGQVIEGNFLTPKLVGDSVGLHPLWVFFSLMAGGSVLGVLGMFLAVPVAAVIGVIASFLLNMYRQSRYYNDLIPEGELPPDTSIKPEKKIIKKK